MARKKNADEPVVEPEAPVQEPVEAPKVGAVDEDH